MSDAPQITADQLAEFQREGYLHVKNLITPEQVEELRRDYEKVLRGEIAVPQFEGRKGEGQMVQLACPSQHVPGWKDHAYMRNRIDVAKQLLGPSQEYRYDQIIFNPPHVHSITAWHQDAAYWGGWPG